MARWGRPKPAVKSKPEDKQKREEQSVEKIMTELVGLSSNQETRTAHARQSTTTLPDKEGVFNRSGAAVTGAVEKI